MDRETLTYGYCATNCPGRCPLKVYTKNGSVVRVESFGSSPERNDFHPQPRACARGLMIGTLANNPQRLSYPLKRTGSRGSGDFQRISWDEALDIACTQLKRVIDAFGNQAVYINYGTGAWATTTKPFQRLLNLLGGYLGHYNNYSNPQINHAAHFMYGKVEPGSSMDTIASASTVFAFGLNAAQTRQGGSLDQYWWPRVTNLGAKVFLFDCMLTVSAISAQVEWIPLNPGTDAALVSALAYECVINDLIDQDFLRSFCVGFYDDTLPEAYQGKNLSYRAYLLGEGYDRIPKTPEWASSICGIAPEKIRELALIAAKSDRLYVTQGWGPQRHAHGEWTAASIMALPCLLGQVGLPGTNIGMRERSSSLVSYGIPVGSNPVSASIPAFMFTEAIVSPETVTAQKGGLRGTNSLSCGIKYLINYGGNCLTNQHGDINRTSLILKDESTCQFILGIDVLLTDSMKYCDVVLPDLFRFENWSQASSCIAEKAWLVTSSPAPTNHFERKTAYEIARLMAQRLGVEQAFTQGKTELDWAKEAHDNARRSCPQIPSWEDAVKAGAVSIPVEPYVALADFREDPSRNPLSTPSGKIELFSAKLLQQCSSWTVSPDDTLANNAFPAPTLVPIPAYIPEWESPRNETFRVVGFHFGGRIHSSWGKVGELSQLFPQEVLISAQDAEKLGVSTGDTLKLSNQHGTCLVPARVTQRIMPGVLALPQGSWHSTNEKGIDINGSINVLTGHRPSPLSFGNPQHSITCVAERAEASQRPREPKLWEKPDINTIQGAQPGRILLDREKCSGCATCMVACFQKFKTCNCWIESDEQGEYPAVTLSFKGSFCGRCSDPTCVKSCPAQALSLTEGL